MYANMPPATDIAQAVQTDLVIRMENVSKVFLSERMETRALNGIYLDIRRGEFLSISGPSGCGKSTLLSIIGLLDRASDGSYELEGRNVDKLGKKQRSELRNKLIGFVFQNFNLIGDMSVYENVELPLLYRGIAAPLRREMVRNALEQVEMTHREMHLPSQLSGGQQQRVAVARALAGKPHLLLADEPTGNLDSKNGDAVMKLMHELNEAGTTICMVTHNEDYNAVATRVIHLFDGRIVSEKRIR